MAQPSSVQREPSMEEILASIRRIIEDSETSRKDEKPEQNSDRKFERKLEQGSAHRAEQFSPAQHSPAVSAGVAPLSPAQSPDRYAQDLAEHNRAVAPLATHDEYVTRAQRVPDSLAGVIGALSAHDADMAPSDQAEISGFTQTHAETSADRGGAQAFIHAYEPTPVAEPTHAEEAATHEPQPIPAATSASQKEYASRDEPEPVAALESAILSTSVEQQVSSSFSDLISAYETVRHKSMADAAEEMLRPMLRDWLDQNLPDLVERLVREQIERISRQN